MKNLADCKNSLATASSTGSAGGGGAGGDASEANSCGHASDLRDELRVDGPWKYKCHLLGDVFYETAARGLTSTAGAAPRARPPPAPRPPRAPRRSFSPKLPFPTPRYVIVPTRSNLIYFFEKSELRSDIASKNE